MSHAFNLNLQQKQLQPVSYTQAQNFNDIKIANAKTPEGSMKINPSEEPI